MGEKGFRKRESRFSVWGARNRRESRRAVADGGKE